MTKMPVDFRVSDNDGTFSIYAPGGNRYLYIFRMIAKDEIDAVCAAALQHGSYSEEQVSRTMLSSIHAHG